MQNSSWPSFLDLLDSDRTAALTDFYRFLRWTLTKVPPRPMRGFCKEDQEDVKQEIFVHCIENNFRVLRQYVPSGKSFAAWLYTVAHNLSIDYIRRKGLKHEVVSIHKNSDGPGLENLLADSGNSNGKKSTLVRLLAIVKKAMARLDEYCRLLLEMAADEFTIKEMVAVLRLPPDQNKKVSDRLRYCREKLKKLLAEGGIDIGSLLKA